MLMIYVAQVLHIPLESIQVGRNSVQDLSNKTQLTILAFGAHPDPFDMPYQAGGTPAKYAKRGHRVIMVSAAYEEEWEYELQAIAKHL
jgi:hypothetical protein